MCSEGKFFSPCSKTNIEIHCIGFDTSGTIGLLHELSIAQDKMLCSGEMKAAEESRKAALVLFGECLASHLLRKEQALLPVAKCSNAEKCVSCGYSGDFGGDKHFSLRKIIIDATHWNWKNCFYFLFSLKIKFAFPSFPSCCSFLGF